MSDTQLDLTIRFWESKLQYDRYLMDPATDALIQDTVKYLKRLQEIDESGNGQSKILADNRSEP